MSEFAAGQCMFPFHASAVIGHGNTPVPAEFSESEFRMFSVVLLQADCISEVWQRKITANKFNQSLCKYFTYHTSILALGSCSPRTQAKRQANRSSSSLLSIIQQKIATESDSEQATTPATSSNEQSDNIQPINPAESINQAAAVSQKPSEEQHSEAAVKAEV